MTALLRVTAVFVGAINFNRFTTVIFLMALTILVGYVVGIDQNPAVHETFHDLRHAMGFPCH